MRRAGKNFCLNVGVWLLSLAIPITFSSIAIAQGRPTQTQKTASAAVKQIKVVAGIVGEGGTVKFLPRVDIRLMPKAYADAEMFATSAYNEEMNRLRTSRDDEISKLVLGRRNELESALNIYNSELSDALRSLPLSAASAVPSCAAINNITNSIRSCDESFASGKTQLPQGLRNLLASDAITGSFDVRTFRANSAPGTLNPTAALVKIPLAAYMNVPGFTKALEKIIDKERKRQKLNKNAALPENVAQACVAKFVSDSQKTLVDIITFSLKEMERTAQQAVNNASQDVLKRYVASKDSINSKYDSLQQRFEEQTRAKTDEANTRRAEAISAAAKKFPPLQQASTSLQGEALIEVPAAGAFLYAEETTTDKHLRWVMSLDLKIIPQTLELTDANAQQLAPNAIASATASRTYPAAKEMSKTDQAEYSLRYGSRLIKTWQTVTTLHDAKASGSELALEDTPLGFGFSVIATSDNVFNTLRMSDNDIAARFFREIIAPYLQSLPTDLKSTGGSEAFQAVKISILGSKKSFADKYAVGDPMLLSFVFRISDVESFAMQKIDAQQLLDRAHITESGVGRITVKLIAGQ